MRITLRQGSNTFELGKFSEGAPATTFRDPSSAARFLRRFRGDSGAMTQLRRFAQQISGFDFHRRGDEEVFRVLSSALSSGRIHLLGGEARKEAFMAPTGQSAPEPTPAPTRSASSSAAPASEPSMFDPDFDAAAQAGALKKAAADGVPFCEECERRRQARAAAA